MKRLWSKLAAAALIAVALMASASGRAPDSPLTGNWILLDVGPMGDTALVLIKIEEKDGKLQAEALSSPILGESAKVKSIKMDKDVLHLELTFVGGPLSITLYPQKPDKTTKVLRGNIKFGAQAILTQLERTEEKKLDRDKANTTSEATKLLAKTNSITSAKEKAAALKEIIEKHGDTAAAYYAAQALVTLKARTAENADDVRPAAELMTKLAAGFGPPVEDNAILTLLRLLGGNEKTAAVAAEYAKKADTTFLKDEVTDRKLDVLKLWAAALRKAGTEDEAKKIDERVVKLDKQIDENALKNPVPFKIDPFAGRKGSSKRVAVIELFTGAQCPPCVSADMAFDAGMLTYKPTDAVFLEYHLHIPGPDPMTNADSLARADYYSDSIGGTPTAFVNGKVTEALGGGRDAGENKFEMLAKAINTALEEETPIGLKAKASRKGEKIEVEAEYAGVKKTGAKTRLRFIVVEDVVHHIGGNRQRYHHHVVRGFIGKPEGLEIKEAKGSQAVIVNVGDLKKTLSEYLDGFEGRGGKPFVGKENPLELKHLKIIALIQDDETKEILQAVQVEVPEAK